MSIIKKQMAAFILIFVCSFSVIAQKENKEIIVDCAVKEGICTYRASGFLNAISLSEPQASVVDPLKPQLFRENAWGWHWIQNGKFKDESGAFNCYPRLHNHLKARIQIVVSSIHGYGDGAVDRNKAYWPGDNNDWPQWENKVKELVNHAVSNKYEVEWDIWNEPDHPRFWARSNDQFFQTWKKTVNIIRQIDHNAVIVGPSIAHYDEQYIKDFLIFSQKFNVLPTYLNWHQWEPETIVTRTKLMRDFIKDNDFAIKDIGMNEVIGPDENLAPGAVVAYFAEIEKAKLNFAARACWADIGCSGCFSNSLDGLLTPDKKTRSSWWVYKYYAEMSGELLNVKDYNSLSGLAAFDPKGAEGWQLKAILGCVNRDVNDLEVKIINTNEIQWNDTSEVRIRAYIIPFSTYWQELAMPIQMIEDLVEVKENSFTFKIPQLNANDAYYVKMLKLPKTKKQ